MVVVENNYYWIILPLLVGMIYYFFIFKIKTQRAWALPHLLTSMSKGLTNPFKKWRPMVYAVIACTGSIALVNPQWGSTELEIEKSAANVYIAMDISNSMMANDVSPSRLEKAKQFSHDLLGQIKSHHIGLVFFAGNAYLQMPITEDYASVSTMINTVSCDMAPTQGTNIREAIELISKVDKENNHTVNYVVLITDGEDHDVEAIQAVAQLHKKGHTIFAVGVGTQEGGFIPSEKGYKRDASGNVIRTKLNVDLINDIAKNGGGLAYSIDDANAVNAIKDYINSKKSPSKGKVKYLSKRSFFQIFVALMIMAMLAEWIVNFGNYFAKSIEKK
jgi:Ca-activated chloride channel homolog